jgi:hypothetical protein
MLYYFIKASSENTDVQYERGRIKLRFLRIYFNIRAHSVRKQVVIRPEQPCLWYKERRGESSAWRINCTILSLQDTSEKTWTSRLGLGRTKIIVAKSREVKSECKI